MKNTSVIKISFVSFILLALLISLFPPFEFRHHKIYDFIFNGTFDFTRKILLGELLVEYILALLISIISVYSIQRIIQKISEKKKRQNYRDSHSKGNFGNEGKKLKDVFDKQDIEDLAYIGGNIMEHGIRDFADWSKQIIDKVGLAVEPHLKEIYDNVKETYKHLFPEDDYSGIKNKRQNFLRGFDRNNLIAKIIKQVKQYVWVIILIIIILSYLDIRDRIEKVNKSIHFNDVQIGH